MKFCYCVETIRKLLTAVNNPPNIDCSTLLATYDIGF